jgi:uncharacterized membrane protein
MSRHKNRKTEPQNRNVEPPAPQQSEQQRRERTLAVRTEFSGPVPPPAILERYDQILPGAAERILAMAERQATHRQSLERTVVEGNAIAQRRGQVLGFILALAALVIGGTLVWYDKRVEGLATIIVDIVGLVSLFIYGRMSQERERRDKVQEPPPAAN